MNEGYKDGKRGTIVIFDEGKVKDIEDFPMKKKEQKKEESDVILCWLQMKSIIQSLALLSLIESFLKS